MIDIVVEYLKANWLKLFLKIVWAIVIFLIFHYIIKRVVKAVRERIEWKSLESDEYTRKLSNIIWNIILVSLTIFNVLIVFAFLWFEVALIIWWVSIAIWFAMETTIKNMVSWLLFFTNKKIKIWDFVEIMWDFNMKWTIEEITIRNTIIRALDKRRVIIPNGALGETPIKTLKSEPMIRWELKINVPRYVDIDQIKNLLIQTINTHDIIQNKDFTSSMISGFNKNGFEFTSYFFLNPQLGKSDFVLKSDFRISLSQAFKKYGIKAPYVEYVVNRE